MGVRKVVKLPKAKITKGGDRKKANLSTYPGIKGGRK